LSPAGPDGRHEWPKGQVTKGEQARATRRGGEPAGTNASPGQRLPARTAAGPGQRARPARSDGVTAGAKRGQPDQLNMTSGGSRPHRVPPVYAGGLGGPRRLQPLWTLPVARTRPLDPPRGSGTRSSVWRCDVRKTSAPPSGCEMKPKPFSALNHLTVPEATVAFPFPPPPPGAEKPSPGATARISRNGSSTTAEGTPCPQNASSAAVRINLPGGPLTAYSTRRSSRPDPGALAARPPPPSRRPPAGPELVGPVQSRPTRA